MRLLLSLCLVGCASANVGRSGGDDDVQPPDAADLDPDAPPPPDAPPMPVSQTLSETTNPGNATSNSATCAGNNGVPVGSNSWYRVFRLGDFGITTQFNVTKVSFGAQDAKTSPPMQVKIGTYTGTQDATTLDLSKVTPLNSATITPGDAANPGNGQDAPITATIPPGSDIIVELFIPSNDVAAQKFFFIGASNGGQSHLGYLRAPDCVDAANNPLTVPTTTDAIRTNVDLNITITGTHL